MRIWQRIPRRSDRLAAAALESLHVGVLVVDRGNAVLLANAAARAMGLVRGEELALNELRALAGQARRAAQPQEADVRLLSGWLPREPVAVHARAVLVGRRGQVGLLVEDVTDARRVEDVRRDFVANVSHELKTPVGALALLGEALQDASDDPAAVRHFSARIRHEATRLGRLVTELIELSRLEAAEPPTDPTIIPVSEIVDEAVDRARLVAAGRDIAITVDCDSDVAVLGNRGQLVTAVGNLVDNAVAYSADHTEVEVSVRRGAHGVAITVRDQGIGIAEEDLDRIFERFYRAEPARSRATGGTGLGLAIVKHTAVNHGGTVTVTSRPGRGSTFTLTLPAQSVSNPAAATGGTR
jgi:two-component system sensor histidine kinase SenX3